MNFLQNNNTSRIDSFKRGIVDLGSNISLIWQNQSSLHEGVVWHVCLPVHSHGEQTTSLLGYKDFHALFSQPIISSVNKIQSSLLY